MELKDASVRRDFLEKHGGSWLSVTEEAMHQEPLIVVNGVISHAADNSSSTNKRSNQATKLGVA